MSDDVRELFKFIGRYQAHTIDLESKLKPFIPDYIPSVGSIDEFIKVPRPDSKPDFLGLKVRLGGQGQRDEMQFHGWQAMGRSLYGPREILYPALSLVL